MHVCVVQNVSALGRENDTKCILLIQRPNHCTGDSAPIRIGLAPNVSEKMYQWYKMYPKWYESIRKWYEMYPTWYESIRQWYKMYPKVYGYIHF